MVEVWEENSPIRIIRGVLKEMEGDLGLTSHHQGQIGELLRYSRFKRSEKLVGIELCFQDFIETRVYEEETYTQDEVFIRDVLQT